MFVTQPSLPSLDEFIPMLKKIWDSKILTNNGPFHQQLEEELCKYLGVKYISLFANGTLALVTALQALGISGEVITTPYSFVATVHSLWWNNIKPVFSDIDFQTCNINPDKIESLITPSTTAILPVHVYGNPCDVERISQIAETYNLKVIYDAAHAFGVKVRDESVLNFGDLSILSFHATKVFNTFEGGAIICHSADMKQRVDDLKNFGFRDEITVVAPGINAKMNEIQAAMGLLQLKYIDNAIEKRGKLCQLYKKELINIRGLRMLIPEKNISYNYSYFPIFIEEDLFGKTRDQIYGALKNSGIYARRYFYPLISQFSTYKELSSAKVGQMPVAEKLSEQVICLPLYSDMNEAQVKFVCSIINQERIEI